MTAFDFTDDQLAALAIEVSAVLLAKKCYLATAESCTGGLISATLTELSGSSNWFERGFVTYSNQAKQETLGVPTNLFTTHGAVSEEVAQAMALGAVQHSAAHYALSVTGIAGPTGGSPGKPVGTVCFGWSNGLHTMSSTQYFLGNRRQVRRQTVAYALSQLVEFITQS